MKPRYYLMMIIIWMALIWTLSSLPSQNLPSVKIVGFDKIAHVGIYFVWGMLAALYLHKKKAVGGWRFVFYAAMMLSAALDEYHQHLIPGREVSLYDFLANGLGLVLAIFAHRGIIRRQKR